MFKNTKGIVAPALLVVLAAASMIAYFLVSSSVPFKDELLSRLYPKPPSFAASCNCEYSDLASYSGQACASGYAVYSGVSNSSGVCMYDSSCSTYLRCVDTGGTPPPPSGGGGGACSGSSCTDCILNNRTDILPFYASNGWDTSCSNQVNIVNNWCNIDPSGCYSISTTTCSSQCGGPAPTPVPTPAPTPAPAPGCTPGTACGTCVAQKCSDGSICATGHTYCVYSGSGNYCGSCQKEVDNCATQCVGPVPTPTPTLAPTYSFNLSPNCNNGPGLSASWAAGTGSNCNAHIYAGSTAYQVNSNCTGTWTGNTLGSGGPAIVNGGTYKLCVNNPGGNQLGCSSNVTTSCSGTPAPTSSTCGIPQFQYNQCVACDQSEPVYRDACGTWSTGPKQTDTACEGSWCTSGNTCEQQTCTFSTANKNCASGISICTGSGVTGFNTAGCTYKNNCSSCSCYVPDPTPAPSSTPVPTPAIAPGGGGSNTCQGRYNYNNPKPYIMCSPFGNFGDGSCDYVNGANAGKDQLFSMLNSDSRLAGKTTAYNGKSYADSYIWFNWVIANESGFDPNDVNSYLTGCGSESNKGAFGLAQMGGSVPTKNGTISTSNGNQYDWGNVNWRQQIDKALNYQQSLIKASGVCAKWNYWSVVSYLWNCQ